MIKFEVSPQPFEPVFSSYVKAGSTVSAGQSRF